jgi:hypothetical protein
LVVICWFSYYAVGGLTVCIVAPLTGIRYNPVLKPHDEQLRKRGKQKKVAITACTPA